MKRAIPIFIILVGGLTVLLYTQLRKQRLKAQRSSGGSATIEGTEVDIMSRLPSRIKAVHVRAGQAIERGQVVAELECVEQKALLAQANAAIEGGKVAVAAAKVGLLLARQGVKTAGSQAWAAREAAKAASAQRSALKVRRNVALRSSERIKKIHKAGIASDQILDQTLSQVSGLDQQLKALSSATSVARARWSATVGIKRAAALKSKITEIQILGAEKRLEAAMAARDRAAVAVAECTLSAPRQGYVLTRNYEPGEVVMPGSRLITIIDIRKVKATFYLPNSELSAGKPGRKVMVKADAYRDKQFEGHITRVGVSAEFTPRNIQTRDDRDRLVYAVEVAIPNPKGLLRPGMPVEITIPGTEKKR